jgi:allantoinase
MSGDLGKALKTVATKEAATDIGKILHSAANVMGEVEHGPGLAHTVFYEPKMGRDATALVASARSKGVNVTCETCPHYLMLTENDMLRIGAVAKCAPPLRPESERTALWEHLQTEQITTIGSDHSPSSPEMKQDQNFFKVWGGISGIQHTLPLLVSEGHAKRGLSLSMLSRLISSNVAGRFNLPSGK